MERTLVLIKPDAVQRGLAGRILSRFEEKGLKIAGIKFMALSDDLLKEHYSHLADKPFFGGIKSFMQLTPVIALCIEGLDAVETVRNMCGITKARTAAPGTIRGDWAMSIQANLVHASDSLETAANEVPRFFKSEELFEYSSASTATIYSEDEIK
jgi:nucleoside-diphosphate kinase